MEFPLYQKKELGAANVSYWVNEFITLETGLKFGFKDRKYLLQPYQDTHPKQVHIKCTQIGVSTMSILKVIHSCLNRFFLGAIYFFPTDSDVSEFSKSRVSPIIQNNPDHIGKYIEDADSVGLKKVGKTFLYFRGMRSKIGMKSVPADQVIFDELDEAPPASMSMARERMAASTFKEEISLSNPTIPDYGIDKEFQDTDQNFWLLKCPHCGEWNDVSETFPDCLVKVGELVILACKHCRKELDKNAGQWVPKYPNNKDSRGYQYSQLFSASVSPAEILTKFNKATADGRLTNFYNLNLGRAYVTAKEALSKEQVLKLCSSQFPKDPFSGTDPIYMGVDQGKGLHIFFLKEVNGKILGWPAYEVDFEKLDGYVKKHVKRCVIDALPETRKARELADRNKGKVYLNFYVETQKGSTKWNDEEFISQENRTESLDASHALCQGTEAVPSILVLPQRDENMEEVALQFSNIAKKLEEDEETGSKRYVWIKKSADHYRHAYNYAVIAMSSGNNNGYKRLHAMNQM